MYEYFAFVDESTAKRYRLCLVAIPSSDLKATRIELQKLRLKGQTRIHMAKESEARQKEILKKMLELESWKCLILQIKTPGVTNTEARKTLFLLASVHKLWTSIKHIVIEESNEVDRDRQILTWIKRQTKRDFEFEFARASQNECLWIADALAWAYSKGGDFRKMVSSRVELVSGPF